MTLVLNPIPITLSPKPYIIEFIGTLVFKVEIFGVRARTEASKRAASNCQKPLLLILVLMMMIIIIGSTVTIITVIS